MLPFAIVLSLIGSWPQDPPVTWTFSQAASADGHLLVVMSAAIQPGWHVYATTLPREDGPLPTVFRFHESSAFELVGELSGPEPEEAYDPNFAMFVRHHSGNARFLRTLRPLDEVPFSVDGEVEYMACNDHTCLPPVAVPFSVRFNEVPKP